MKTQLVLLLFISLVTIANAQNSTENKIERKGFLFGAAVGISSVHLTFSSHADQNEVTASFPNFKIGSMISKRAALLLYLPGSLYNSANDGRNRVRGFEAIIPSVQYWLGDRLWLLGGVGLGMDAPAFYDIKDEGERKFYFGHAATAGVGYEVWRKGKFAMDFQSRIQYGTSNRPEGKSSGLAFGLLVGFNLY